MQVSVFQFQHRRKHRLRHYKSRRKYGCTISPLTMCRTIHCKQNIAPLALSAIAYDSELVTINGFLCKHCEGALLESIKLCKTCQSLRMHLWIFKFGLLKNHPPSGCTRIWATVKLGDTLAFLVKPCCSC